MKKETIDRLLAMNSREFLLRHSGTSTTTLRKIFGFKGRNSVVIAGCIKDYHIHRKNYLATKCKTSYILANAYRGRIYRMLKKSGVTV